MVNQISFSINHLQHIGIPVSDISVSETFYKRLGFNNVMQAPFMLEGDIGTCIMMKNKDVIIELYQLPGKQLGEIKKRNNGHIDHIAFDVNDIDVAFKELKNNSFQVLEKEPAFLSFWEKGCRYFNISGPDGEQIEFNQLLKDSPG
jgi:lactoylglutathione lyase